MRVHKTRAAQCPTPLRCGAMVGSSSKTERLFGKIRQLAPAHCPVLITGETGVGKELVARALHEIGGEGPWVAINCAAISSSLAESEFFGHDRGAFTGATSRHRGAFERANGGTLLLDEVGELPLSLQAQLLRVLETGEFQRVGGERPIQSKFRLVAATNRDLAMEVRRGTFRRDLYYRLSVADLRVLPLRERLADLPVICRELLQMKEGHDWRISGDAVALLGTYTWPGNVRELGNVLTQASLCSTGKTVTASDISLPQADWSCAEVREPEIPWGTVQVEGRTWQEVERDIFRCVLRCAGGVQAEAARRLGLPRQSLHDRLRRLGISQPRLHHCA